MIPYANPNNHYHRRQDTNMPTMEDTRDERLRKPRDTYWRCSDCVRGKRDMQPVQLGHGTSTGPSYNLCARCGYHTLHQWFKKVTQP